MEGNEANINNYYEVEENVSVLEEYENILKHDITSIQCVNNANNVAQNVFLECDNVIIEEMHVSSGPMDDSIVPAATTQPTSSESEVSDPEYIDKIVPVVGGRKLIRGNHKDLSKCVRYSSTGKQWKITCDHDTDSKICHVKKFSHSDINAFFNCIYLNKSKIEQDAYILKFMKISDTKRKRRKELSSFKNPPVKDRLERISIKYFMINSEGKQMPICSKSFESITCIKRRRLNLIGKRFLSSMENPTERRGGSRLTDKDVDLSMSIFNHIQTFKMRKSHHTRKDTQRSYLPPELSVKKMWRLWKKDQKKKMQPKASYSKYYDIFIKKFNLGFGHPRQDVCSYCTEANTKIKNEKVDDTKKSLKIDLVVHKARARKFFDLLKEKPQKTVVVCFDMMQNQPLPKLNVTDVFYSRQIWLYILNFVICSEDNQGPENNFIYTWLESESGRGPNEVCSALNNFLQEVEKKYDGSDSLTLRLFSDSCSAQNKNQFMTGFLLNFVNKSKIFNKIEQIFPVRGHSYMPADRTFGRIEKIIRKKKEILSPVAYYSIFEKFSQVKVYGKDFQFHDYKSAVKPLLKPFPFKITEQKVIQYIKGKKASVGVSSTYSGSFVTANILKKQKMILTMDNTLQILQKQNHIKKAKKEDVAKLMKYFTIPPDAEQFYNEVLGLEHLEEESDSEEQLFDED